jgi:glycosyltransferase involved in cell wall biosynthesis
MASLYSQPSPSTALESNTPRPYQVVLICNFKPDRQESILRYGDLLAQALAARGVKVSQVHPRATVLAWTSKAHPRLTKWISYIDKLVLFPCQLSRMVAASAPGFRPHNPALPTIYHIVDHGNAPYLHRIRKMPHVVTCHDALAIRSALGEFPENPTKWTGRILQRWILRNLKESRMVVCVSRQTELDLKRVGGLPCDHLTVIPHALNYDYRPMEMGEANAILAPLWAKPGTRPERYFFHVGGTQWYKNREGVLDIFAAINRLRPNIFKLVIAGKPNTEELEAHLDKLGIRDDFSYVGEVTCEELNALYARAEGLLFPSLAEGFGWPIVEAQAAGCPVFIKNALPMSDIGGDAAGYIDPENVEGAAKIILQDLESRESMVQKGKQNSARYAREVMIDSYLRMYDSILEAWKRS